MDDVVEILTQTADTLESKRKLSRRDLLKTAAVAGTRVMEAAFGSPPSTDVLAAGEPLTYPFAGLDRGLVTRYLRQDFEKEDGRVKAHAKMLMDILGSSDAKFTDFAYGNPTPYGDGAMRIYRNLRPSFQDKDMADEYANKDLLVAPNLFYLNQDLRNMMFDARDEALKAAGMSIDDLKNGEKLPEKLFDNSIQRRYNEIDATMRSMRGEKLIFAVVRPSDGSFFPEGPYWKANSHDVSEKKYWDIQYIRPVIIGDVKSAFHTYDCTPELTGMRDNNFLADIMPGLYKDIGPYRNNNHRPLCVLLKP